MEITKDNVVEVIKFILDRLEEIDKEMTIYRNIILINRPDVHGDLKTINIEPKKYSAFPDTPDDITLTRKSCKGCKYSKYRGGCAMCNECNSGYVNWTKE